MKQTAEVFLVDNFIYDDSDRDKFSYEEVVRLLNEYASQQSHEDAYGKTLTAKQDYTTSPQILEKGERYKVIHQFKSFEFSSGIGVIVRVRRVDDPKGEDEDVMVFDKNTFFNEI